MSEEQKETAASGTTEPSNLEPQRSRFTRREKWFIVGFIAFVGLFSPLTSSIYLPAIPELVIAFDKSTELIFLTVTVYIVLQGIAPMIWGTISDYHGRRPITAACLLILSLSCVGLALVPTSDYWLLMLLRCLQAAGSASTIAVGAGVIGDISNRAERGGFYGVFTLGPLVGPAIAPIIGGALTGSLGWRSLFWFLCIASSICFVIIILIQPETLESVIDKNPILYRPVIPIIGRKVSQDPTVAREVTTKIFRNPFKLFLQLDIVLLLAINAIAIGVFYGINTSTSSLFLEAYPFLDESKVGLCYLAIGGGMIMASFIMGRVLDWEYETFRKKAEMRITSLESASADATKDLFPLEKARLRLLPFFALLMVSSCAGYGWTVQRQVNIACPLILQFLVGFSCTSLVNLASTLMIDLVPDQSSSVTACNNFLRCSLGAILVSVLDLIINGIGVGWTCVLLGGLAVLLLPLIYGAMIIGPRWRMKRQHARDQESAQLAQTKD